MNEEVWQACEAHCAFWCTEQFTEIAACYICNTCAGGEQARGGMHCSMVAGSSKRLRRVMPCGVACSIVFSSAVCASGLLQR